MRKSKEVPLTLLAALALYTTGCHDTPESVNCVDSQGRIVASGNCESSATDPNGVHYRYIYGGSSGGHIGDAVVGGSATSSSVSRGGFGHAGGGEGGGE
jgi:hypothetical protein